MSKGTLVVISGFSGVGKGTIVHELLNRYDNYKLSVSATTRKPRDGEEDGRDYFFISHDEFDDMIAFDKLIEYAKYVDNYYGTPRDYVENELEAGNNVILEIEIQGAGKIKKKHPESLLIFVAPPSAKELHNRLLSRGTETPEVIRSRMRRAIEESEGIENYDYIVVNDNLNRCVEEINNMIELQKNKVSRQLTYIKKIQSELREYWKGE